MTPIEVNQLISSSAIYDVSKFINAAFFPKCKSNFLSEVYSNVRIHISGRIAIRTNRIMREIKFAVSNNVREAVNIENNDTK